MKSASIRNIMAELEAEGYITRPHPSAGRVPTEKSFRHYVDRLLELKQPDDEDIQIFRETFSKPLSIELLAREAGRALSNLTSCAGVVLMPRVDHFIIKNIKFVAVDSSKVMVVIVGSGGMIHSKIIRIERRLNTDDLARASNYLDSIASGLTLHALRDKIVEEIKKEKTLYDKLLTEALKLGQAAFDGDEDTEDELYVEGTTRVMEQPEFKADFEKMKRLFGAIEEKSTIVKILNKSMEEGGIHIYMGSESEAEEFEDLSFVIAPYGKYGSMLGTLGVIGPVRMDYSKIIPLVNYAAGTLGKVI